MLQSLDILVLGSYLAAVIVLGLWFARRRRNSDDFMAASRSLPGWAVGLSMFGSYVSSISFLANPGKAYAENWNAFAFTLAAPVAALVAARWFVPFFRRTGEVSAYEHLERRFGPWARTYAVVCFLLTQMARMGAVVYLLGLAVAPLTGWPVSVTIVLTGALTTVYTMAGGIRAVVWIGVLQSIVLVAGTALCLVAVVAMTPGGASQIVAVGNVYDKFSLGSFELSFASSTFWVTFAYGLFINMGNFAVDQSYVQRYIAARSERDAAKSVWLTTILYVPTAAIFFFIGTALYVLYLGQADPSVANLRPDEVFPHFIATQLPVGTAGLVVAAIFAASMDSNLSSMATLTLCDLYKRYFRPQAEERESMRVLVAATLAWGMAGTAIGLAMIRLGNALDAWWQLAGLFSGGVLGLFSLGLVSRRAGNVTGVIAVIAGLVVIVWMTLPILIEVPPELELPLHNQMTIVVGTLTIFLVGLLISSLHGNSAQHNTGNEI